MLDISNASLQAGVVPKALLDGLILPIPKKGPSTLITDMRPISLLEHAYKLLTRVLTRRITRILEDEGLLQGDQWGFRAGRGCGGPLMGLRAILSRSRGAFVASIDLAKAFDSVEGWALQLAYRRMGLPEALVRWLSYTDSHGVSKVITRAGLTEEYEVGRGVRQGEVMSPLKFILWVDVWLAWKATWPPRRCRTPRPSVGSHIVMT